MKTLFRCHDARKESTDHFGKFFKKSNVKNAAVDQWLKECFGLTEVLDKSSKFMGVAFSGTMISDYQGSLDTPAHCHQVLISLRKKLAFTHMCVLPTTPPIVAFDSLPSPVGLRVPLNEPEMMDFTVLAATGGGVAQLYRGLWVIGLP